VSLRLDNELRCSGQSDEKVLLPESPFDTNRFPGGMLWAVGSKHKRSHQDKLCYGSIKGHHDGNCAMGARRDVGAVSLEGVQKQ